MSGNSNLPKHLQLLAKELTEEREHTVRIVTKCNRLKWNLQQLELGSGDLTEAERDENIKQLSLLVDQATAEVEAWKISCRINDHHFRSLSLAFSQRVTTQEQIELDPHEVQTTAKEVLIKQLQEALQRAKDVAEYTLSTVLEEKIRIEQVKLDELRKRR